MSEPNAKERIGVAPTRTELVWPGKRAQVDHVALPFQVVETINQSRATREKTPLLAGLPPPPLFEGQQTPDTSWKNKLIWGENKYVMASLLQGDPSIGLEPLAGKVDLIYIDPPFATGQEFSYRAHVGEEEWLKEASIIEETAYRDTWGRGLDSYLQMMYERLLMMRELLAETGNLVVHLDHHVVHYVKAICDEVLQYDNFLNEIIWHKGREGGASRVHSRSSIMPTEYQCLLLYARNKSKRFWNPPLGPYRLSTIARIERDEKGWFYRRGRMGRKPADWELEAGVALKSYVSDDPSESREKVLDRLTSEQAAFVALGDVWDKTIVKDSRVCGYATEKPEPLLEILIKAASQPGDLVADFFCGSGTAMAVAEKLGRRWIGCDLSRYAIQVSRKRLLDIQDCKPFQVLNLGKYERKHWQINVLNGHQDSPDKAIVDYYRFILSLYHAEPVGGYTHLHGQLAGRWVHVGAADAPVTRAQIMDAIRECQANRYTGLDVLGWEWEMGLHDTVRDEAKRMGVDLRLLVIPREVMDKRAVQSGDVHFYELAYLKTTLLQDGKTVTVRLEDFIIPNPDLVPDEVQSKVKKWSDYIDFWAVDWNYQSDTFHNQWQTYRTRKGPTLRLISDPHPYTEGGPYRILVKVIDIFGNDTTQLLEVAVP